MKRQFEEKGIEVIVEMDRPIAICRKDGRFYIGAMGKRGTLVVCRIGYEGEKQIEVSHVADRFLDLQDDLKNYYDADPS